MKYNAFISYSHSSDSDLAPSIERALERFAKPTFKRRALNIFRDSSDLSASPDLWGKIEDGLSQSEYFVFFASPRAAESKWCKKEVEFWKANKPFDNFLIVLTEGELAWDDTRGDFDWQRTNCLPENLSGVFRNEPLYVDFKDLPAELSLENPDFASKLVILAATLHGRSVADMVGEDARQHRRTLRIRNGAIAVLGTLLLATIGLAAFAFQQREEALSQAGRALARSYLGFSKAHLTENPTLALRLAERAYRFAEARDVEIAEYEDQLIRAFYNPGNFYLTGSAGGVEPSQRAEEDEFEAPPDVPTQTQLGGNRLVYTPADGLYLESPGQPRRILEEPSFITSQHLWHSFADGGRFVLNLDRGHQNAGQYLDFLQVLYITGELSSVAESGTTFREDFYYPPDIKFDARGRRYVIFGHESGVTVVDYGGRRGQVELAGGAEEVLGIDMTSDGQLVALGLESGSARVRRLAAEEPNVEESWELSGHASTGVHSVAFSDDGRYLYSTSTKFTRRWNAGNDAHRKHVTLEVEPLIFENLSRLETHHGQGYINLDESAGEHFGYYAPGGEEVARFERAFGGAASRWTSGDGRYYATRNGVFNRRDERLIPLDETRYAYKNEIYEIGFSTDGRHFFIIDKLFFLDPNAILARLEDPALFGELADLSPEERRLYLSGAADEL